MSIIKKRDVKNYLSARRRMHILSVPVSHPDATGFSGPDQSPVEPNGPKFAQDFTGDHTTVGNTVPPPDAPIEGHRAQVAFRAAKS